MIEQEIIELHGRAERFLEDYPHVSLSVDQVCMLMAMPGWVGVKINPKRAGVGQVDCGDASVLPARLRGKASETGRRPTHEEMKRFRAGYRKMEKPFTASQLHEASFNTKPGRADSRLAAKAARIITGGPGKPTGGYEWYQPGIDGA